MTSPNNNKPGTTPLGFAAFASQYLSRQQQQGTSSPPPPRSPPRAGTASTSTQGGQPMFFSFTTDGDGEDSYQDERPYTGGAGPQQRSTFGFGGLWGAAESVVDGKGKGKSRNREELDLDDLDDPHLMLGGSSTLEEQKKGVEDDEDDPYLRLDEHDEHPREQQRIPLLPKPVPGRPTSPSASASSPPGWLAHLTRSPSPLPPRSESETEEEEEEPGRMFVAAADNKKVPPPPRTQSHPPQPQQHISLSMSLTDSLLPRDGQTRAVDMFSLPDPLHLQSTSHRRRRRTHLKHNDALPLTIYLSFLLFLFLALFLLLTLTHRPANFPPSLLPYAIALRTIPVLVSTALTSAVFSYAHVWLLSVFVKPVMIATEVGVPLGLLGCALWAFVGSFGGAEDAGWGETTGLRLFSLIPLLISLILFRRLLHDLPRKIHTSSATLTLSTRLLMQNPLLLALSPALLVCMLLVSVPFVALGMRFLLVGYSTGGNGGSGGRLEWHVKAWADWGIVLVVGVWIWTWAVARGVLRTTAAGVIGDWYFSDPTLPPAPPLSTHTIHAALFRSTRPSLGSIVLAGLILTLMRVVFFLLAILHRLPNLLLQITAYTTSGAVSALPLPYPASSVLSTGTRLGLGALATAGRRMNAASVGVGLAGWVVGRLVPGVRRLEGWVRGWVGRVSGYALVYVGLTGVGFWEAAGRAGVLVGGDGVGQGVGDGAAVGGTQGQGRGTGQGRGKTQRGGRMGRQGRRQQGVEQEPMPTRMLPIVPGQVFSASEPALYLLSLSPLSLTLPAALLSYLFVAHTLGAPHEALGVALLAGGTAWLVGAFCVGLVGDVADTMFLCYWIDRAGTGSNNVGVEGDLGRMRREEVRGIFEYGYVSPSVLGGGDVEEGSALPPRVLVQQQQRGTGMRAGAGTDAMNKKHPETNSGPGTLRSPLPLGGAVPVPNGGGSGSMGASRIGIPIPGARSHAQVVVPAYSVGSDEDNSDLSMGEGSGSEEGGTGRTPKQGQGYAQQQQQRKGPEEEEEDVDPFAGSVSESGKGEEDMGRTPTATATATATAGHAHKHGFAAFLPTQIAPRTNMDVDIINAMNTPVQVQVQGQGYTSAPTAAAAAAPQGLAGLQRPRERMMTSTQELNVKSRFLMDLNASAGSEASRSGMMDSREMGASASGEEEGEGEGEGEGSELGPGSDFFK